jgi:hypothetical protein
MKLSSDTVVIVKNRNEIWKWIEMLDKNLKPRKIRIYRNGARHIIIKIYKDDFIDVIL